MFSSRFAVPTAVVVFVALMIAAPIVILGEASSSDARTRLEQAEVAAVTDAADHAADLVGGRVAAVLDEITGVNKDAEYAGATSESNAITTGTALERFKSVISSDVDRLFVVAACGCAGNAASVLASVPTDARLGQPRPAADYARSINGVDVVTNTQRIFVAAHAKGPPTIAVAVAGRPNDATFVSNTLVADIPVSRLADWLRPIAAFGQRAYFVDDSGRAITASGDVNAVATQPVSELILAALRGKDRFGMRLDSGPSDDRNIAIATVPSTNWHVLVVRPVSAAESDLGNITTQQRWLRAVLIAFLLVGAALVGWFYQRLRIQGQALALASRHKSDFLASMSHELRTPLNAIIGFSDVLLQRIFGDLNARQDEYLRDILSSGKHQLALVNDILDLSKVEAGRMELEVTRFSLAAVVSDASALLRERASQKGIQLIVATDETLGSIDADERKIKQVLVNLVMNAIKFTPSGGTITVDGKRTNANVTVWVTDTGIGIAADDQTRIFEEFRQAGKGAARAIEGTGLGLSLAKRFIELHGGTLSVVSTLGAGSKFVFVLPQPVVAAA